VNEPLNLYLDNFLASGSQVNYLNTSTTNAFVDNQSSPVLPNQSSIDQIQPGND